MGKSKNKDKKSKRRKRKKGPPMAEVADRHVLYQKAVQAPEVEIEFFEKTFRKHRRRKPWTMKEDFCGTALLTTQWAKSHKKREGWGVDIHEPTLEWGREHNVSKVKKRTQERIHLINANVLDVSEPKVDITCALNFSYCVFKDRELLTRYFEKAYEGLGDDGIFFCELYGGTEAIIPLEEERECDGFTYVWDQHDYNPITNETLCYIHFDFPDGSRMEKAFTYDWRLWTIPEVRECMREAGFPRVDVYWDPVLDEDDDEAEEDFRLTEKEENQEGWLVYFVGIK